MWPSAISHAMDNLDEEKEKREHFSSKFYWYITQQTYISFKTLSSSLEFIKPHFIRITFLLSQNCITE